MPTQFNLFYQYMLLLTNVKQFSNLLNIKKEVRVTLFAAVSLLHMSMTYLNVNPVPKIPIATTSNSNFSILHGKLTQIAKK